MDLTASQHQLLLAIRGHGGSKGPTIGEVAADLLVAHNTAVGLVDRTQELGLIDRERDPSDHRVVRLALSAVGREKLNALSAEHVEELARLAAVVDKLVRN
ncbi:MarR family transcriptional regulator [Leekyejoonella antrihumi]|uniref:MarR family transcriptional regulator n=2 Tax=Leekyejoonella antrihumi TaxID=1660198 RepID=A0A563DZZ3_9MICO|nr:MarR family transcriptional regulator [Leekyejoonella antrihumi]